MLAAAAVFDHAKWGDIELTIHWEQSGFESGDVGNTKFADLAGSLDSLGLKP